MGWNQKRSQGNRSRIATDVNPDEVKKAFTARYDGHCPLCCKAIHPGELIFYRTGPKPMHLSCPTSNGQPVVPSGLRSNLPKTGLRSKATG